VYTASGFTEPPGVEAGTLLQPDSEEPRCWWASLETLAGNSYNLTAGCYKPQIAERPPEEDPAELIREVLALEREITEGLEKLLQEIEA
jgi:type I restriction enzyme M protein